MRILIYRIGSIGDTIVALPCFHLIARVYPEAQRYVLTNFPTTAKEAPIQSILGESGLVHGYLKYPLYTRDPKKILKLRSEIVQFAPDVLVYLTPARGILAAFRDLLFFKACGIRKIIGIPLTGTLQTHLYDRGKDLYEPEAMRLSRCIASLGDTKPNEKDNWNLLFIQKEKKNAAKAIKSGIGRAKYITCCAGTNMPSKDWGVENWGKLLEQLCEKYHDVAVVFIGSPDEFEICNKLQKRWKGHSVNLCGKLSPRESAIVIQHSVLFLGHDSGPMHLASAVDTPCVAIFSARNKPAIWFPFGYEKKHRVIYHKVDCFGCYLENCTTQQKKCILSINTKEVLSEIESLNTQYNFFA